MPAKKKKTTKTKAKKSVSVQKEFQTFWGKLDGNQQLGLVSMAIILIAFFLGLSVITQQEIFSLKSEAYQNRMRNSYLQQQLLPEPAFNNSFKKGVTCDIVCPHTTTLNPATCTCEPSDLLKIQQNNGGF